MASDIAQYTLRSLECPEISKAYSTCPLFGSNVAACPFLKNAVNNPAPPMKENVTAFYDDAMRCPFVAKSFVQCPFLAKFTGNCPYLANKTAHLTLSKSDKDNGTQTEEESQVSEKGDAIGDTDRLPPITTQVNAEGLLVPGF